MITTTSPSLGARTQIDVRVIERELTELWKNLAKGTGDEKPHSVTRTCVLNLIIVTGGGLAAEHATATVAHLTASHPNRAFVISAASKAPNDVLDAWVQMHCQIPSPGRPQVCGEQISIDARGAAIDRVPGTILSLLVPDVPVMLWWPHGEPFDNRHYAKYASLVNRVIVDSATFTAPEEGLTRMAAQISAGSAVSDLAWSRLTPWRELTAQFFDAPALVPHLSEITRVTIDYETLAGEATDRSQALLLIGWLAARLGWHAAGPYSEQSGTTILNLATAKGEPIAIELRPAEPVDDALDRLAALTIECRRARFSVGRDAPDCAVARSEVEGMQPLQRKVRLEQLDEAGLLSEELQLLGHDKTFEAVLKIAATLMTQG